MVIFFDSFMMKDVAFGELYRVNCHDRVMPLFFVSLKCIFID